MQSSLTVTSVTRLVVQVGHRCWLSQVQLHHVRLTFGGLPRTLPHEHQVIERPLGAGDPNPKSSWLRSRPFTVLYSPTHYTISMFRHWPFSISKVSVPAVLDSPVELVNHVLPGSELGVPISQRWSPDWETLKLW